jgi:predicted transglutaminase-like cysteine proteinase
MCLTAGGPGSSSPGTPRLSGTRLTAGRAGQACRQALPVRFRPLPAAAFPFVLLALFFLCAVPAGAAGTETGNAKDWTVEPSSPRAPGELHLRGYTLRPAENGEAKNLRAAWDRVMQGHNQERFFKPHPNFDKQRLAQWHNIVAKIPTLSAEEVLRHINGFFNGWPSKIDADSYGEEEHWATPEEFVRNNGGDCEDYALVKYMALRNFDVPAENMWMLLVYDRGRGVHHAVLAVYAGERLFMLDNLSRPSYLLIPEAIFLKTFTPLIAVNEKGILFCKPVTPQSDVQAGAAGGHSPAAGARGGN